MKISQDTPIRFRKIIYGNFMKVDKKERLKKYNNRFEKFCSKIRYVNQTDSILFGYEKEDYSIIIKFS
jgi:hypothetical protein